MVIPSQILACRLWFPFLTIFALIHLQLVASQSALIINVCARTDFVDYCKHALMSDPSSRGADLHRLGQISIGLTLSSAQRSRDKADQLIRQTRDIVLVGKLRKCRAAYDSATMQMRNAGNMWGSGDVGGTRRAGFASIDAVFACRDALGGQEGVLAGNNVEMLAYADLHPHSTQKPWLVSCGGVTQYMVVILL
ncbi:hypothetical protein QQ045_007410 [Rhodiola kirilowii]